MMQPKYVTIEECNKKPHLTKLAIITLSSIVIGLLGTFVILVGYAATEASAAANQTHRITQETNEAINKLQQTAILNKSNIQSQQERFDIFITKLDDINHELKDQRTEQRELFKKIIELQVEYNKTK